MNSNLYKYDLVRNNNFFSFLLNMKKKDLVVKSRKSVIKWDEI